MFAIPEPIFVISEPGGPTERRRVAATCVIGNVVEYLDFAIYGFGAAGGGLARTSGAPRRHRAGTATADPGLTIVKELRVSGSAHAVRDDLTDVVGLVPDGVITPTPARRRPLTGVADAHAAPDARTVTGRAVVIP